ncbi:MAG: DUF3842 family protein [Spirochaetaceae bacterium]|jgi:hypothetical protein|nr:DUF3842 family protein [Spirochaetaceae bacterium]
MKRILVVDGLGGGIGTELISRLRDVRETPGVELIALATNAVALERMLKAGATRGAAGENAIRVVSREADIIVGPIGVIIADSMMGEITAAMASAVLSSPAERILLPLQNEHITFAGFEGIPLSRMIEKAAEIVHERLR